MDESQENIDIYDSDDMYDSDYMSDSEEIIGMFDNESDCIPESSKNNEPENKGPINGTMSYSTGAKTMSYSLVSGASYSTGAKTMSYSFVWRGSDPVGYSGPGGCLRPDVVIGSSENKLIGVNQENSVIERENSVIGGNREATQWSPKSMGGGYKQVVTSEALSFWDGKILNSTVWNSSIFNQNSKVESLGDGSLWIIPQWVKGETCQEICRLMSEWCASHSKVGFGTGQIGKFYDNLEENPAVTEVFRQEAEHYLPKFYRDREGQFWQYSGVNPIYPWAKYDSGENFGNHRDTGSQHPNEVYGKFTCLIYLNEQFEGGKTVFYDNKLADGTMAKNEMVRIQPQEGMGLFFDIDLLHQGEAVRDGTKYWIGFEILYTKLNASQWNEYVELAAYYEAEQDGFQEGQEERYWQSGEQKLVSTMVG